MAYLLLGSALLLSSIAAYFSVVGLSTIFPGSIVSIIVMAFGLELAKIIVAVWAHQNWKKISRLTKIYLSTSVIILMGITSMGIFGFLSKSHIEHSSSVSFSQNLIKEIVPDVLVKGGDYNIEDIVGFQTVIQNGGLVKSLSFYDGYSTTNYINKINKP